jgi:hypothetical protein
MAAIVEMPSKEIVLSGTNSLVEPDVNEQAS